jgi:hypothetical protein
MCALALETEELSRILKEVPAGTSVDDGTNEELGEIPLSCPCWLKGRFP